MDVPVIGVGVAVAAAGWLFLIFGVGTGGIASFHKISIASNVIHLGYAISFLGAMFELPKLFVAESRKLTSPAASEASDAPEKEALDWSTVEHEFTRTFNAKAKVHSDGRVTLTKGSSKFDFKSVDEAWQHCLKHFYVPPAAS